MNFLIIFNTPPYGSSHEQEGLDFALAAAAFDHPVRLLFMNAGIFHLLKEQHPESLGYKKFTDVYHALKLYDIEHCYIAKTTLEEYCIGENDLMIKTSAINDDSIKDLIHHADLVIRF